MYANRRSKWIGFLYLTPALLFVLRLHRSTRSSR